MRMRVSVSVAISVAIAAAIFMALVSTALRQSTVHANSATAPEAPANLAATSGDSQVTLTWEAPSSNGGADITGYEYRHHFGVSSQSWPEWTSAGTALTVTVTGLLNGRDYTFEVRAVNSVGGGTASSIEATPTGAGPLTALSVEPGTTSGGPVPVHRPGTISPTFSSSTYDYTVTVEHGDTHLTFNATAETGYGKQLRMVGDLGYGEFWFGVRDLAPNLSGHQVRLGYGENWFRYAVYTGSDGTAEYHYNIRVTRPYPPLNVSSDSGRTEHNYTENHTTLIDRLGAYGEGRDEESQTWSLSGEDADDFSLTKEGVGGRPQVLRFAEAPDYESPTDSNADNVYRVTVQVTEGDERDSLGIAVTVADVADDDGVAQPWLKVWDGSVDLPPLDPDVALAVTEGGSLTFSVRPGHAPGAVRTIIYGDGGSGTNTFAVTSETSDSTRLARPEANDGRLYWSLLTDTGWQAWKTITFTAAEDDDSSDNSVTLTFTDRNGVYAFDTLTFTVNIDDNDPIGGL